MIYTWVAHEADCDRCDQAFADDRSGRLTYPNLKELLEALTEAGWQADAIPGRVKCKDCAV